MNATDIVSKLWGYCDILRDEAEAYAERLQESAVDVTCKRYDGLIHAYIAIMGTIEAGKAAFDDAIAFINQLNEDC